MSFSSFGDGGLVSKRTASVALASSSALRRCKMMMSVTTSVRAFSLNAVDGRRIAATSLALPARAMRVLLSWLSIKKLETTETFRPPGRSASTPARKNWLWIDTPRSSGLYWKRSDSLPNGGLPMSRSNAPSGRATSWNPECSTVACGYSAPASLAVMLSYSTPMNRAAMSLGIRPKKLPEPIELSRARPLR